jgi:membrane protein
MVEKNPLNDAGPPPDLSPEARRQEALQEQETRAGALPGYAGPGSRFLAVVKRVWIGAYNDGFIHAGNFAYMSILALFPFFIVVAAIFSAIGEPSQMGASIDAFLTTVPPVVAKVIGPVAHDVVESRSGWLLWIGGLVGLWTASSLIETIRDILHRAYGTPPTRAFWRYRLASGGVILASVLLLLISLAAQVVITAVEEVIAALIPQLEGLFDALVYSRFASALVLFGSLFLLFASLTPAEYQRRRYPKWPGALLVTVWWSAVTMLLPRILRNFFTYDLTYGSLAGVMIALFFFWLVGLGMVVGAELNAALAETPEERNVRHRAEKITRIQKEGEREGSE